MKGFRAGGPTAAHRVAEGLKWFASRLELQLPLKSPIAVEQAAIPGDHIEQQEEALALPYLANMELFCLAMHKAALKVSLHIGMVVPGQTIAVLRQRHQTRARLLSMLDNGGVLGRRQQGKRREGGRARAFDFSVPPHGMLIRNFGKMLYASWISLTMPDGSLMPFMCPEYTGTLGAASCQFDFSGAMELP